MSGSGAGPGAELGEILTDLAREVGRIVSMLMRMSKVRLVLAVLAGLALAAILAVGVVSLFQLGATRANSASARASASSADSAAQQAAQAASSAKAAAESSKALLDTVNGLLDPRGPAQAAAAAGTADRTNQLYCVVLIANGYGEVGPTCASTIALLQSRGVLP